MNRKKHARLQKANKTESAELRSKSTVKSDTATVERRRGFQVFWTAIVSLGMMWLSFPPVGFFWLAWFAPIPLVWLVQAKQMPGRRPYWQLYYAGLLYWLGTFYFIPIPHPLLWFGWILVSLYMATYTPIFVGAARTLVHRFPVPGVLAVPIAWTGIEWIRSNFATGMAMVCLSHSQYEMPVIIQVADLFGAYTLSFVMMLVAVGLTTAIRIGWSLVTSQARLSGKNKQQSALLTDWIVIGTSIISLAAVLAYGRYRLNESLEYKSVASLKVGLIQTCDDVVFRPLSEDEYMMQLVAKFKQTWQARRQWGDLDLIVWPESGFSPYTDLISDNSEFETVDAIADVRTQVWSDAIGYPDPFPEPIPLLTGGGTIDPENDQAFASAFLIAKDGQIETRYYKNHLVMFGEYVPFADWFPFVKRLSPIGGGISAGTQFEFMTRNNVNVAPSICFESTSPHYIRRQINTLDAAGHEPDAMVNMTNDGWFYGTSCLDLHLACNVFRAVEMRKPHLVCANTGFSAEIDSCGRLLQTGPRRKPAEIRAEIKPLKRTSLYRKLGDLVPMLFGGIVLVAGIFGWLKQR